MELQSQLEVLPRLQEELEKRETELSDLRGAQRGLQTKYGDLEHKYESSLRESTKLKAEWAMAGRITSRFDSRLEAMRVQQAQASSTEQAALKESVENLKGLLSSAEQKYARLSSINSELQKKIDVLEQQNHIRNDQMWKWEEEMRRSSINMRGKSGSPSDDVEDKEEEMPLLGNVREDEASEA